MHHWWGKLEPAYKWPNQNNDINLIKASQRGTLKSQNRTNKTEFSFLSAVKP